MGGTLLLLLPLLAGAFARTRDIKLEMGPGLEGLKEANKTVTEDDLPDYLGVVVAKRQELAPGLETGANGEGSEEENAELPADFDVVAARAYGKRQVLAPGLETEGSEEESTELPESLDVVAAKRQE